MIKKRGGSRRGLWEGELGARPARLKDEDSAPPVRKLAITSRVHHNDDRWEGGQRRGVGRCGRKNTAAVKIPPPPRQRSFGEWRGAAEYKREYSPSGEIGS